MFFDAGKMLVLFPMSVMAARVLVTRPLAISTALVFPRRLPASFSTFDLKVVNVDPRIPWDILVKIWNEIEML